MITGIITYLTWKYPQLIFCDEGTHFVLTPIHKHLNEIKGQEFIS